MLPPEPLKISASLLLIWPALAMAGNLASGGMPGMTMYVFEEANTDTALTVNTRAGNGNPTQLKMIVFDGASAAQMRSSGTGRLSPTPERPPDGRAPGAASSSRLFQEPQSGQRPSHLGETNPQPWQR